MQDDPVSDWIVHSIGAYQSTIEGQNLTEKLEALAEVRTEEGYMVEVQFLNDGSFFLVENHCPICATATACAGFYARELKVFQTVLGEDVKVERTEYIVAGARRCVYRVDSTVNGQHS